MKIFDIIPKKSPGVPKEPGWLPETPVKQKEPAEISHSFQPPATPAGENQPAETPVRPTREETRQPDARRAAVFDILKTNKARPPLLEELRRRFWRRLGAPVWVALAIVLAFMVLGVVTFLYPRVSVTITAKQSVTPLELFLTIDGTNNAVVSAEGRVPGKFLSVEEEATRTFSVTGKKTITAKARGTLTVFNAFNSRSQTLVATTRFEAPNGKIFRLVKATTVPGADVNDGGIKPSSIAAEVEADQPGSAYNIGSADFTIPGFKGSAKFTGFYAKSNAPMTGGAEGETSVVRETDLAEGRRALREELLSTLEKRAREDLPEHWEIFPGSISAEILSATPSAAPGDITDAIGLRVRLRLTAVGYQHADLQGLAVERLAGLLGAPEKHRVILDAFQTQDILINREKQTLSSLIKASMKVDSILDKQEIVSAVLGKREQALKSYLAQHEGIKTARVTFWPFWVKRVPKRERLVTVTID